MRRFVRGGVLLLGALLTFYKAWAAWSYWRQAEEILNDPSARDAHLTFAQVELAQAIGALLLTVLALWALRPEHGDTK